MGLNKYRGFLAGQPLPAENVNSIDPDNDLSGLTAGYLRGGTGHSALAVFQALASGSNNGKITITIDGVEYTDMAINLLAPAILDEFSGSVIDTSIWTAVSAVIDTGKAKIGGTSNGTHSLTLNATFANTGNYRKYIFKGVQFPKSSLSSHMFGFTNFYFWNAWDGSSNFNISDNGTSVDTGIALAGTHELAFEFPGDGKCNFYIDGTLVRTGTGTNTGTQSFTANVYDANLYCYIDEVDTAYVLSLANVAGAIQASIRTATSGLETCQYDTDHFIITSGDPGTGSEVLKMLAPSSGTDITGNGATPYLDMATNATEFAGGDASYNLVRLDADGKIPQTFVKTMENITTTAKTLNTVYQNTGKTTKFIIASIGIQGASGTTLDVQALIGATSTPATLISRLKDNGSSYTERMTLPLIFIVPPSYYYKISTSGSYNSTPAIDNWFECDLL